MSFVDLGVIYTEAFQSMEPQFTSSTHRQHMSDRTKLFTIYMDIESLVMIQFYTIYLLASRNTSE